MNRAYRLINNLIIDWIIQRRFVGGLEKSQFKNQGIHDITNSSYEQIRYLFFELLQIKHDDIIVDVGCGKGRVINFLLWKKVPNQIIGCEYHQDVGNKLKKVMSRYPNVEIRIGDIFEQFPENGTWFFLFNPFEKHQMQVFINNIKNLPHEQSLTVVYTLPKYYKLFVEDPYFECTLGSYPWSSKKIDFIIIKRK
jgi:SAM-dependent methyltransferase